MEYFSAIKYKKATDSYNIDECPKPLYYIKNLTQKRTNYMVPFIISY